MNVYIKGFDAVFPNNFELESFSNEFDHSFTNGTINAEFNSEFTPNRSDEKIMRRDIKISVVSILRLLKKIGLEDPEVLEKTALFVANGSFIEDTEKYMNKISVYKNISDDLSEEEKMYKIYRASPPLLALETLTNSSMSFIAQYAGVKYHNTTFGTSSLSAYYALKEAIGSIKSDLNEQAIVCASNSGGGYSFLSNSAVVGYKKGWKESTAVGNIILSSTKGSSVCKISMMSSGTRIPNLKDQTIRRDWSSLVPEDSEFVIFSGAFCEETNESDRLYCENNFKYSRSLFDDYGNMGSSNLVMGIIQGIQLLNEGMPFVDIIDRDLYGRESHVRIAKC